MTSAITGSAYSSLIRTTTKKLDASLPTSFDVALDQARAIREATAQIEGSAAAVNARIINCLKAGSDWRTDKELQGLMFERVAAANGIRVAGVDAAEEMIVTGIVEHTEAIISAWSDALAPDIAALAEAAKHIDIADLADADVPQLSRKKLVAVWADARTAVERFKIALQGWGMVAAAARLPRSRDNEPFVMTDSVPDAVTLGGGQAITAWTLARAGAPLSLATPAEYLGRLQRHEAVLLQRRREYEEQQEQNRKAALR